MMVIPEPTTTTASTDHLYQISNIVSHAPDWKEALEKIIPLTRSLIIFDNMAVYISDPLSHHIEVMFARAVGRGRSAEADITWGESLANRIMDDPQIIVEVPPEGKEEEDRLKLPYLVGIPLTVGSSPLGAVTFVRFGGPPFSQHAIQLADFISQQIGLLVERENLKRTYELLETQSQESRLQEDFISTITHELRTPLGFIKGYSTTLLRVDTTWDTATQQEFLKIIDQETDRLQELIENLLDSARLQSGTLKMDFQPLRMDTLIRGVWEHVAMNHPGFTVHIEASPELRPITGDPKRLGQVFENLFTNAVKYAPGSDVWVKITSDETGVSVLVQDQGPGIPQRYLNHLFERFFRNPDISPSVHGTGLGLFICKKIIQAHSGTITATSQVGQGTQFHIHLPDISKKLPLYGMPDEEE